MADFTVAGTRYREFGFPAEAAANAWELVARAALIEGRPIPRPEHTVTQKRPEESIGALVRHVAQVHWSSKKAAKVLTRNAELFAEWCGEAEPAALCLTTAKIGEYTVYLQGKNKAGGTINRHLASVSKLAKFANGLGMITAKPMLSKQREGSGRIRWFTEAEEDAVLATLHLWGELDERDLFIFLCDTGARLGEALKLDWKSLDQGGRLVTFWDTKAGTHRTIVMTQRVREAIIRRRAKAGDNMWGPFVGINRNSLNRLWARLRTHHSFLEDAVVHTYRHTCASRLVMAGVELVRVKEWMGHLAIQTTLRYAHLSPKAMEDVAAALERKPASTGA